MRSAQTYIEIVHQCHVEIHAGKYDGKKVKERLTGEPDVLEICKSGSVGACWKSATRW
jgi:hypothetical protein